MAPSAACRQPGVASIGKRFRGWETARAGGPVPSFPPTRPGGARRRACLRLEKPSARHPESGGTPSSEVSDLVEQEAVHQRLFAPCVVATGWTAVAGTHLGLEEQGPSERCGRS